MTVAIGPSLELREQLQQHAARAGWLVLVGPLPAGEELAWIQAAAQAGVPVLAIVPGYEQGEELKQELQQQGTGGVTLCSELLGGESGEVCWYRYNDARHNGTTPPELLQAVWPNLKLASLELRPTRRLDGVLSVWLEQAGADAEAPGLLWLPAMEASAVLSGAGAFLERLEAIWLEGSAHPDGLDVEVLTLLEASCHRLTIDGAQHQLWQLDQQRLLERQVVLLTQQREALQGQLSAQSAQTAEQSQQREVLQGRVQELEVQLNAQSAQTAEQSQQREVLQGRVQELEVQLNAQSAQTAEQSQQREVLQGRVQELEVQLNAQSAQTAEQSQQREVLQGRVQELEVQLNAQSAQTAEQSQQREVLQARVQELEVQLNAQSAQTAEQSQQREVLQGRVQELEAQLNAQSAQTAEQSQQREVLQGRVQELDGQHTALSMERDQLLEARNALQNQVHEQQERFDRINIELDEILSLIDQDHSDAQESREIDAVNV